MQENQHGSIGKTFLEILVLAIAYVLTARLGQMLAISPGNVTPVWLPSGIVLAAVLWRGAMIWPGVWLGAFVGNVWAYLDWENFSNLGVSFISGSANGLGDTLGVLIAASLIRRFAKTAVPFNSAAGVVYFVVFGALLNSAVSASFGVTGLAAVGLLDWSEYVYVWTTWWVGDAVGVILITPWLLTFRQWFDRQILSAIDWRELLVFVLSLCVVTELSLGAFSDPILTMPIFMILPVLLWGAMRFNDQVAILGAVSVAAVAIVVTSAGSGPFKSPELNQSLIELQMFLCTVLIIILLFRGVVSERKHLQQRLDQASKNYLRMFDRTMGGVLIVDDKGRIESVNQAAESIFGYDEEELMGRNVNFLLPNRFREKHSQYIESPDKYRISGIFGSGREVIGKHRDGHEIPLMLAVNPADGDDQPRYIAVFQDLSEFRRMEHSNDLKEKMFRLVVESAFDAMIVLENNRVVNVNERFETLFAYSAGELLDKNLKMKLFTTDLVFIEGQGAVVESEGITKHGRRFPVKVQQKSLRLDSNTVKIISIYDMEELQRQEKALNSAIEKARDASMAKSRFLSSMSHELRTPMNAIVGFAQLLDMGENQLTDRQRESIGEIRSAGNHLLGVIDDILDLARIEAGTFVVNCEDVDVNALISDCVELTKQHADKRGIKLFNHLMQENVYFVHADPFRLKQIIMNLLSNAVKFNHADGTVAISAEPTTTDRLRVSVTDSGMGLSDTEQSLVFQPFERASAENSAVKGTGIGLVIAKSLLEQMDGEIGLESYKYMGSTFWIELGLSRTFTGQRVPSLKQVDNSSPETTATHKNKILYVEDQPGNVKLLEHLIESLAIAEFHSADNGALGLEVARKEVPDLIVLDINMPGLDGYGLLKLIREDPGLAGIPVIALSSSTTAEDRRRGYAAGFDDYMTKPVDLDQLAEVLKRFLPA